MKELSRFDIDSLIAKISYSLSQRPLESGAISFAAFITSLHLAKNESDRPDFLKKLIDIYPAPLRETILPLVGLFYLGVGAYSLSRIDYRLINAYIRAYYREFIRSKRVNY